MMTALSGRFEIRTALCATAVLLTLAGCCAQPQEAPEVVAPVEEPGLEMVTFTGGAALMSTDGGNHVEVLGGPQQALDAGVSQELVERLFAQSIECSIKIDRFFFHCWKPATCNGTCVIYSAKKDGGDERQEEPDEEGKVVYLPGRIYWCPCE